MDNPYYYWQIVPRGGAAAWTPPDASVGTKLWYRADLGAGVTAGLLDSLADQSGLADAGRNQTSLLGNRPNYSAADAGYGGKATMSMAGAQRMLSGVFNAAIAAPVTVVAVGEMTADSAMFSNGVNGDMIFKSVGNVYFYGAAQGAQPLMAANVTVPCVIMYSDDGTAAADAGKIYVNSLSGAAGGSGLTNWGSTTEIDLGLDVVAAGQLVGKLAEVIVFGGILSAGDKANLVTYLNVTRAYGIGVT
jgi:hypothetical protein